ncbi:MAG: helicase, partial [Planctomycetaceae bacterium]|nr:helicase [Planctomycetaceae bacterium]
RLQLLESVLGVPGSLMRSVRVPNPDRMPPGPLANEHLNSELLTRGLATQAEIVRQEEDDGRFIPFEDRVFVLSLAEKLKRLFQGDFPEVRDVVMDPVWIAGELLNCGGDFNKYVTSNDLTKQEGIVFRHVLRLILLLEEFATCVPPEFTPDEWQAQLRDLGDRLTAACREIDPESTEKMIEAAHAMDVVEGESHAVSGG